MLKNTRNKHYHDSVNQRMLGLNEVITITGLGKSTIYALMAEQKFPQNINLVPGGRRVAWLSEEIQDYIDQRIAVSRQNPIASPDSADELIKSNQTTGLGIHEPVMRSP